MLERLVSGKFLRPHGLSGEIGLMPYASSLERYLTLKSCYVEDEQGQVLLSLEVVAVRLEQNVVYLRFKGLDNRDVVAGLTNYYLSVDRAEAAPLKENSYYVADLIGLSAWSISYGNLGKISDFYIPAQQPIACIKKSGEADLYLPLVSETVLKVDLRQKEIQLKLPEGLYEIYRSPHSEE